MARMGNGTQGLTERKAKAAQPPENDYVMVWDQGRTRIPGFGLRVTSAGAKSFTLDYRVNGRKRRYTIGAWPAWSVQAARERAAKLLRETQAGHDPADQLATTRKAQANRLGTYLAGPYADHQARKKSGEQTLSMIRNSFASLLSKPLPALSKDDIAAWRKKRETDGLKYATIKRHFDALQGLLNQAVRDEYLKANPLAGLKLHKPASTEAEQLEAAAARKMLTDAETEALFAGLEAFNEEKRAQRRRSRARGKLHLPDLDAVPFAHVSIPWFRLAYFTGFRPGDLFGLQWEHVNFARQQIRKVIEKTAAHIDTPQTFPLSPAALATLSRWWEQNDKPAAGYVFASARTGGRMDKHAMQKPWRRVRELGGLSPKIDIYTLRHNFASQLIKAGTDLFAVSKLMAHTDIQTTINNYSHLAPDHAAEAVAKLPRAGHE